VAAPRYGDGYGSVGHHYSYGLHIRPFGMIYHSALLGFGAQLQLHGLLYDFIVGNNAHMHVALDMLILSDHYCSHRHINESIAVRSHYCSTSSFVRICCYYCLHIILSLAVKFAIPNIKIQQVQLFDLSKLSFDCSKT
jgi:hypothetical protein